MNNKIGRRVVRALATTAVAGVSIFALVSPASAAPGWQVGWERNYFHSKGSCQARGDWIIGEPPWAKPGISGVDDYRCYKEKGFKKYSMDIHWTNID